MDDRNSTSQYFRRTQSASILGTSTPDDVQTQAPRRRTASPDSRLTSLSPASPFSYDIDNQNSNTSPEISSLNSDLFSPANRQEYLARNFIRPTDSFAPYLDSISPSGMARSTRRSASEGSDYIFHPHGSDNDTGSDTASFSRFYANEYSDNLASNNNAANANNATNALHQSTSSPSVDRMQNYLARSLMGQSSAPWREEMHRSHSTNSLPQTSKGSDFLIYRTDTDNHES